MSLLEELTDSRRLEDIYNRVTKYAQLSEETVLKTLKFPESLYHSLMSMSFGDLKWGVSKSDLYTDGDSKGQAREFETIYGKITLGQALDYARVRDLELRELISSETARDIRALIYLKYEKEGAKRVLAQYKEKDTIEKVSRQIDEINKELANYGIINSVSSFNQDTDNIGSRERG